MIIKRLGLLATLLTLMACDQLLDLAQGAGTVMGEPTESEIAAGIREALVVGAQNTVALTSRQDGFFKNSLIKIPFPPEAAKVEKAARDIGLNKQVDEFVMTLNRGAEKASQKATPIFVNAIKQMTLNDVYNIWRGEKDAATQYLQRTTRPQLKSAFRPVIKNSLDQVDVTKYWNPIISNYNKIPFVQKLNPDLDEYVLDRSLDGLFTMIAQEEAKIREDPMARVSELLKKVFGYRGP